ncbi:protein FAM83H [Gouania willdenowi]|uniref:Protein FAM83H-like n=1 Tax=Gouania willdenowi TaxID=441366 RepID=A0A8C5H8C5_GOUWI|nr:protein FAM83H-like [Gouania willdenowi]
MARRSQCSSAGDNPLDPNYLPPHYREEYRLAIDALVEEDLEGYYRFLQKADVVDFLATPEIQHIQTCVQNPRLNSFPEHQFRDVEGDGSSDTYWPLHTDLDVPDLDLGWPQMHHLIGPTEVTTLVNPPEPNMPSIKDQARRLIKNAQQVIAIVMDTFTDVDIFADILNAAMRNVAVYIILDEQNAPHFTDMVSNCRVNLQNMQFLRVRTVPGITYQCRSGKSFKGQLMDRFLLTDCRAVLSGNYSFMWSFEKLHRCMAHLFLGQLVATFDEEFRILFAQSQPMIIDNMVGQMEDLGPSQKMQYPGERITERPKIFLDSGHSDEWGRHSYDERIEGDWMRYPLRRPEAPCGPVDMYTRFPSQQPPMEQPFDQGPLRIPMKENLPFKRHSFAEGSQERFPYHFLQQPQGLPDSETQGRYFHRGQKAYPGPGPEADYSGIDKFWKQDYLSCDQYSEPQPMQPPDSFDPVLNYLTSTRAVDMDQSSEKQRERDMGLLHNRRPGLGHTYTCRISPTPSNQSEQKTFLQEPNTDRKNPSVKRGLRNWRISSYLSAYDNPEDDGLAMAAPQGSDPFEEPSCPVQETIGGQIAIPKIPNVREFKVPATPRASQMPSYARAITQDQQKYLPDEPPPVPFHTNITPTPSESSNTTESEKADEAEQREPKTSALRRDDSFRRNYNAAQPRASRLRSSLIFHSLDQQNNPQDPKTAGPDQQEEESDKGDAEQLKLPYFSQVLGQRRPTREPFEWSRYLKSSTDGSKQETRNTEEGDKDDKDSSKDEIPNDLSENPKVQDSLKLPDVGQVNPSSSVAHSKKSEPEQSSQPIQPPPFLSPLLDFEMDEAYNRFRFFKELAAKRKAQKALEEKSKEKLLATPASDLQGNVPKQTEKPVQKESTEKQASTSDGLVKEHATKDRAGETLSTGIQKTLNLSSETTQTVIKQASVDNDSLMSQGCNAKQTEVSTDSQKSELESVGNVPKTEVGQSKSLEKQSLINLTAQQSETCASPTSIVATSTCSSPLVEVVEASSHNPCSEEGKSACQSLVVELESPIINSNSPKCELVQEEAICSPPVNCEQDTQSASDTSKVTPLSPNLDNTCNIPSKSSNTPKSITLTIVGKTKPQNPVSSSQQLSSQSAKEPSNVISLDKFSVSEPNTSLPQPTSYMSVQQVSDATLAEKDNILDLAKPKEALSNSEKDTVPEKVSNLLKNELENTALKLIASAAHTSSVKELAESGAVMGSEKDSFLSEGVSDLEKCDPDTENIVSNLAKDVSKPERVDSGSNEKVRESGKDAFEAGHVSRSEIPGCSNVVSEISEDLEPSNALSSQTVESSVSKLETVCPVDMSSDKSTEALTSVTSSPVIRGITHDAPQLEKSTPAQDAIREVPPHSDILISVCETNISGETVSCLSPHSFITYSGNIGNISPHVESDISNDRRDSKPNIASTQPPTKTSAIQVSDVTISERGLQKENLKSDKDVADSVDVTESEKSVQILEKEMAVSETVPTVSEKGLQTENVKSDKDVADSVEDVTESEKSVQILEKEVTVSGTVSTISEKGLQTENVKSDKDVADSVEDVTESEKSVQILEKEIALSETVPKISEKGLQTENVKSDKDVADSVEDVTESEKSVQILEKEIALSEAVPKISEKGLQTENVKSDKDVADSVEDVAESEKGVQMLEKEVSESEKTVQTLENRVSVSGTVSTISETGSQKENLKSDKDVADSVEVAELEKGVQMLEKKMTVSDTVSTSKKNIIVSEEGLDSEKDASLQEQMDSDLGKTVSESGKEAFETRQVFNLENPTCPLPVVKETSDTSCPNPPVPVLDLYSVENYASKADSIESISPVHKSADTQPQISPSETSSAVITDIIPKGSQSETPTPPQNPLGQINPSSDLATPVCNAPSASGTVLCLSLHSESDKSVLSPEAKIAETSTSPVHDVPDTESPSQESDNPPKPTSTNSLAGPPEPIFNVPVENNLQWKNPEPVTSEKSTQGPIILKENGKTDEEKPHTKDTDQVHDEGTEDTEKTNDKMKSHCPEQANIAFRHPKPSQSRYHSSTANVLSSSNLRDDTKLLLGQISANSQSRNESSKDSPVTDDEKEGEADKNAQKQKYPGSKTLSKEPSKSTQERDRILEKIQNMRKERKVYSRFEV